MVTLSTALAVKWALTQEEICDDVDVPEDPKPVGSENPLARVTRNFSPVGCTNWISCAWGDRARSVRELGTE